MDEILHLEAEHISGIDLGHHHILVLVNPISMSIEMDKFYSSVNLLDHVTQVHCMNRRVRITKLTDTEYSDNDTVKRVIHLFLNIY